ncbi:hypothetical protein PIB30_070500 [Stylosanthes scabra]|uniref:Uncharacterized protein n=1 Tax=Stylosanthes scabra TaxID=79078 RepID=A0ABU6TPD0_9FABA|nr:hypothetical protein [Stylosanthes scabra]
MAQTPPPPQPEPELPPQLALDDYEFQEWDEQFVYDMLGEDEELNNQVAEVLKEAINYKEGDELQQQQNNPSVHEEEMPQQLNDEEMQQEDNQQLPESPPVNQAEEAAPSRYRQGRWDLEEHRLFLRGNEDHPGEWAHIAANYVKTRSMQQVASHAQKYFIHLAQQQEKPPRRVPKGKKKSIFDTTLDDGDDDHQQPPHHGHDVPSQSLNLGQNIDRPLSQSQSQCQRHLDQHQQPPHHESILDVPTNLLNLQQNIVSSPSTDTIIFHHLQSHPQFQYQPQLPQFQFQRPQHPLLPPLPQLLQLPPSSTFEFQPRQHLPPPPFELQSQQTLPPLFQSLPPLPSPFESDHFDRGQPLS